MSPSAKAAVRTVIKHGGTQPQQTIRKLSANVTEYHFSNGEVVQVFNVNGGARILHAGTDKVVGADSLIDILHHIATIQPPRLADQKVT